MSILIGRGFFVFILWVLIDWLDVPLLKVLGDNFFGGFLLCLAEVKMKV